MPKAEAKHEEEAVMAATPEVGTSTKAKLAAVIGTFQEFDTTMRIGTRVSGLRVLRKKRGVGGRKEEEDKGCLRYCERCISC